MKYLLLVLVCFSTGLSLSQDVQWVHPNELDAAWRKDPKPVMVFIHTDWCKICAMQKQTTFKDSSVVRTLNQEVYAVSLDAESADTLQFLGRKYAPKPGDVHELAMVLGGQDGKMTYPTTLILSKQLDVRARQTGLAESSWILSTLSAGAQ